MVISSEELYRKLESEYRISTGGNRYFDSCEAKNNRELVHFNNERCLLYSYKNNFSSFLSINNEAELAEYCSQRLQRTKNIHLKCIYSFKLFYLSKDKKRLFDAISYSEQIMREFYLIGDKDNGFEFGDFFQFLYPLCKQYNKADTLVKIVNEAIINTNSNFHLHTLYVLNNFVEACKKDNKSVTNIKKDFSQESLTELCLKDYESESNSTRQKRLLDFALIFSKHISNKALRKKVCELKGDYLMSHLLPYDDKNIIIPHYNASDLVKAIGLYKEAQNEEKRKFEGIMRIIVNRLGEPIVKEKDGNTEFVTLECLLKTEALKSIFTKEDLLLFNQTYTKAGYNIRNDIAHGLLLPQEYTAIKALLVFVSILRLAKGIFNYIYNQQIENIQ